MYSAKQREMYNHDRNLTCERLNITINQYNHFRRFGQDLHTLYEMNCNGELTEEQYETRTSEIYRSTDRMAKDLNLEIFYQTDPRGATIYLSKNPIPENSYNTSAECVY